MATWNYDHAELQEDSDQESEKESEDEIDEWMEGTQQKGYSKKRSVGLPSESNGDEFEKEMMSELNDVMSTNYPLSQCSKSTKELQETQNDELFYDPKMDDDDEKWVKRQRDSYHLKAESATGKDSTNPKTDAVLNCPACMCTVCLDCQKHSTYENQYRAMFTLNTMVNYGEVLQFKKKRQTNSKNKRKRKLDSEPTAIDDNPCDFANMETVVDPDKSANEEHAEYYYAVNCSNCNTKLAIYDSDEVYHFFNAISSYG